MKPDEAMLVVMTVADLREIVRQEIEAAIKANHSKTNLTYNTKEAAAILGVPETWLATAARENKVKCVRIGRYIRFRLADLENFTEIRRARVSNQN